MYILKAFFRTRGSSVLIILFSMMLYVSSKNYREVLLYGDPGFTLIEIFLLIAFYIFFKQIQQDNLKAKIYALFPLFAYYIVYEVNLLQFGSVLKFQDFLLLPEFLDVLPVSEAVGIIFIVSLPALLIISNLRKKWHYNDIFYPIIFLLGIILLSTINGFSKRIYENLSMQTFSHEHVVAMYGPLSAAFMFENRRKVQLEKIERYSNANKDVITEQWFSLPKVIAPGQYENIHLIILESFIDVRNFQNINLNSEFLKAFDSPIFNQSSVSLAPGFGNGTARSEFEILCGMPSVQLLGALEFNIFTGKKVIDCLPAILNDHGYKTIASHPYKPDYYNRINAYKTLGFSEIMFGDKYSVHYGGLKIDAAPGGWLYDESLFAQNIAMLKANIDKGKPVFNYVLTTYGHYPFKRNEVLRPDKIRVAKVSDEINRLLNQMFYRIEALEKYVRMLRQLDPHGLIVVIGDHLPPLSTGKLAYKSLGYSTQGEKKGFNKFYETPVFIINDGQYMPLPVIRHYDVFQIVLNVVFKNEFCKLNQCRYLSKQISQDLRSQDVVNKNYIQLMSQGASD